MARICKKCGSLVEGARCKPCTKAYHAAYGAKYYREHRAQVAKRIATRRAANKEHYRAVAAAHYQLNKERIQARHAAWRDANRDRVREGNASWRAANRYHAKQIQAVWVQNNKDRCNVYVHNRRARIRQNGGQLPVDIRGRLFTKQGGLCACCAHPLGVDFELDHIMPLSLGGRNEESNVQLLRKVCNRKKRNLHPDVWRQMKGVDNDSICQ